MSPQGISFPISHVWVAELTFFKVLVLEGSPSTKIKLALAVLE